ncbi:MAG: FRG domain-containing protein [Sphingobacteriales bacterium JAD_PAG50586_3]|nr:MAG: FRG domain-containing protein [Sphingobacteriales bacterium JAD_PAG50586_3]
MEIKSAEEYLSFRKNFINALSINPSNTRLYRGHANEAWNLVPGLCRDKNIDEQKEFSSFLEAKTDEIQRGHYLDKVTKYAQKWFELIQCQHLYYKTRLLDWTISLDHSLYFAVSDSSQIDARGCIWVYEFPLEELINDNGNSKEDGNLIYRLIDSSPFEIDNTYFLNYPFYADTYSKDKTGERNRMGQYGRFSIRPTPLVCLPLEEDGIYNRRLRKLYIAANAKNELVEYLSKEGITNETVYKNYAP